MFMTKTKKEKSKLYIFAVEINLYFKSMILLEN